MKRTLLCLLVLCALANLNAQKTDTVKGKTAILFNVVSLNLQGYNGGVGFKYHLNDKYAVKGSLDFAYNDNTQNDPNDYDKSFQLNKSIGFTVDLERTIYEKNDLSLYCGIGGGPLWSAYRYDSYVNSSTIPSSSGERNYTASLRTNLLFGVVYNLNNTFSLSFQQTLNGQYSFGNRETFNPSTANETETESFSFDLGSSSLILLIYF